MDAIKELLMNLPVGVNLFELIEIFKDDPFAPKSFKDIPAFEQRAREHGYLEAAEYLHSWRLFIEYHMRAEWEIGDY